MGDIIFVVEDSNEDGYTAKALGYSIHTEGETLDELKENIRDAVKCHFDEAIVLISGKTTSPSFAATQGAAG